MDSAAKLDVETPAPPPAQPSSNDPPSVQPTPPADAPPAVAVEDPDPVPAPEARDDDDDDGPEPLELDYHFDPFQADLDGDGRPELIEWTCDETKVTLVIGKATFKAPLGFADLIGCSVCIVDLDPGRPGVQLWLSADEHEEAGDDRNFVLRYRRRKLQKLWVEDTGMYFDFYPDGSWRTEVTECDEAERLSRTTTTVWRLVDGKVTREETSEATPLDPGDDCGYDPSEPSEPFEP